MATSNLTFALIGNTAATVDSSWSGQPLVLDEGKNVSMITSNGSMIFAYENMSTQNSKGKLSLGSGGGMPISIDVFPGTGSPEWKRQNWGGNNLSVTNISGVDVPIRIQAVGPGIPGNDPLPIEIGKELEIAPGKCAQTNLLPAWMRMTFKSQSLTATFGLIGGPVDGEGRNAFTFTVNATKSTPITPGSTPPPGDYSTTANKFDFSVNWGAARIFVANLSGKTSTQNTFELIQL
jgi:hypothetical protein